MFGFGKKNPGPVKLRANPGVGSEARVAVADGVRTWSETINVVKLAAQALEKRGFRMANRKTWLEHTDSGFMILPQFVGVEPLENGALHTLTTMQSQHPTLTPRGVFEYQHSTGNRPDEAIFNGLDQWVQTDFVPLLEALRPMPEACTTMQLEFPASEGRPERVRRAILGPIAHFAQQPAAPKADAPDEHPFCPCCLLTKSFEAFQKLIEGDDFVCLRLFAARDDDGVPSADCRVNGEDFEPGMAALRQYAATWPTAGYEFRKQYVVLHNFRKSV